MALSAAANFDVLSPPLVGGRQNVSVHVGLEVLLVAVAASAATGIALLVAQIHGKVLRRFRSFASRPRDRW